ncbi:hypothetical protein ISS05_00260 [Candidatus Woesearchaeota archaeon]|nr:hypothetical protein [Candidatus Woesearchaeota archaeon]
MFWNQNKIQKKISNLHNLLSQSFGNVKQDTGIIFQWLDYFHKKNLEQEQIIKKLQLELSYIPKTKEDLKRILDSYYSYGPILEKINDLKERIDSSKRERIIENEPILRKIRELDERIEAVKRQELRHIEEPKAALELESIRSRLGRLEQKKDAIKEKIIKRITRNSKDYVKSILVSYIKKYEKISALQLKEMIVEEQGLCSKSSFYRILEEIEIMNEIATIKKGKEKHYMAKKIKLQ